MGELSDILTGLSNGSLLPASAFDADLDAILDLRDTSDFEDDWLRAAEDVQYHWDQFLGADLSEPDIDRIRELAFKRCNEFTDGSEIGGYVSDDFELLAKASAMSLQSPYLANMKEIYARGALPH